MEKDTVEALRVTVIKPILEDLSDPLNRAGIYYRVFSRAKSLDSIQRKLKYKGDKYREEGRKLQDIIGIRFVFYFLDDIEIFASYLRKKSNFLDESNSANELKEAREDNIGSLADKVFMPSRLNLVFKMDDYLSKELRHVLDDVEDIDGDLIDATYEVQLRTVLSEGWHEVEHDLRYKYKDESWWNYCHIESRMLNGIYASLETNEMALSHLFFDVSYKNYKRKDWEAMIRNHLRIKLKAELSTEIKNILNSSNDVAKLILKQEKGQLISLLFHASQLLPLRMDNVVYLINEMQEGKKSIELSELLQKNLSLAGEIEEVLKAKDTI